MQPDARPKTTCPLTAGACVACIGMAYIDIAYIVMAHKVVAYIDIGASKDNVFAAHRCL